MAIEDEALAKRTAWRKEESAVARAESDAQRKRGRPRGPHIGTAQRMRDADERARLWQAIVDYRGVRPACAALGLHQSTLYQLARRDKEFDREFRDARATAAEMLWDECIEIADNAKNWWHAKLRIETRMRVAGKLVPRLSDAPEHQVNVLMDNRKLVIVTEQKRAELQQKLRMLRDKARQEHDNQRDS